MIRRSLHFFALFAIGMLLISAMPGSPTSSSPKSTTPPSTTPQTKAKQGPTSTSTIMKPENAPGQASGELFNHPGVVSVKDGRWVGLDNFVNISKSMAIQVNIIKPEGLTLSFDSSTLEDRVLTIFEPAGITRISQGEDGKPPLPFFNIVIVVYPYREGFASACVTRLFEEVRLNRVNLDRGETFQAITWEQTSLAVASKADFEKLLFNTIDGIANNFVKRLASYQNPAPR